jgi:hypothetical protein
MARLLALCTSRELICVRREDDLNIVAKTKLGLATKHCKTVIIMAPFTGKPRFDLTCIFQQAPQQIIFF